ncbi:MAG: hypothetical protein KI792_07210 [Alphaproteobacteria bacterium]|nr:hypothetical protein [Alphaproteobacteria bacterium SS10]
MNRTQKTAERLNKFKGASRITLFIEDDYDLSKHEQAKIQRVRDAIDDWLARHRGEYEYVDGVEEEMGELHFLIVPKALEETIPGDWLMYVPKWTDDGKIPF